MAARYILIVLAIMVILVAVASGVFLLSYAGRHVLRTSPRVVLGSKSMMSHPPAGWLMPSDALVSTSYVSTQTFDRYYMNAYVILLSSSSYPVQTGTTLSVGLYINGQLMGTRLCYADFPNRNGGWASYGTSSNGSISLSTFECGVTLLKTAFPAGSMLTLTVRSNHPAWMQVDSSPTTNSYETASMISPTLPSTINPFSGTIAPHTITIDAYSD